MQFAPSALVVEADASLRPGPEMNSTQPIYAAKAMTLRAPAYAPPPLVLDERAPLIASALQAAPRPNPYPDYNREFTYDGGIRITYKDLDERLSLKLMKFLMWAAATAATIAFAANEKLLPDDANLVAALAMSAFYAWLVYGPVELYRTIEIRPDCMILDDEDVFWLNMMEGLPLFRDGEGLDKVLYGLYGTRFVDYLTVRSFDPEDVTPFVLESHLTIAMQQQWGGAA